MQNYRQIGNLDGNHKQQKCMEEQGHTNNSWGLLCFSFWYLKQETWCRFLLGKRRFNWPITMENSCLWYHDSVLLRPNLFETWCCDVPIGLINSVTHSKIIHCFSVSLLVLQLLAVVSWMLLLPAADDDEKHDTCTYTHVPSMNFFLLILLPIHQMISRFSQILWIGLGFSTP